MLDDLQQAYLWQALQSPPKDGGLWNSRKVADWIAEVIDRPVDIQRGWDYLRQMELRLKCPRPTHEEADLFEQEAWKKKTGTESSASPTRASELSSGTVDNG